MIAIGNRIERILSLIFTSRRSHIHTHTHTNAHTRKEPEKYESLLFHSPPLSLSLCLKRFFFGFCARIRFDSIFFEKKVRSFFFLLFEYNFWLFLFYCSIFSTMERVWVSFTFFLVSNFFFSIYCFSCEIFFLKKKPRLRWKAYCVGGEKIRGKNHREIFFSLLFTEHFHSRERERDGGDGRGEEKDKNPSVS